MESLSYTFEGKGLLCADDIELDDGLVRSTNLLKGWDEKSHSLPFCDSFEMRKPVLGSRCFENLRYNSNHNFRINVCKTPTITSNSLAEFGKRFSSSPPTSDEFDVPREPKSRRCSVENSVLHTLEPLVRAKPGRITYLQSQIPVCQVLGCNKDLSSSKDYHKRHRVCDLHSKTAVVIVNGLQQRFCQQCSRFHLLSEFDNGKRSCRKRLAGHNERRRKPQFGSVFYGTSLSTSPILSQKVFEGGFFVQQGNKLMNRSKYVRLEHELCQLSPIEVPTKFSLSLPKSLLHLQHPSENLPDVPFSVQELSADLNSSSAPSLLSAQSQNLLSNSSGNSMACPLIFQGNRHANLVDNKLSYEIAQESFLVAPDATSSVGSGITRNMHAQNLEYYLSSTGANSVDLVQLSLHLQRVEDRKYSNSATLLHHEEDLNLLRSIISFNA